jgi:hypothetical protein
VAYQKDSGGHGWHPMTTSVDSTPGMQERNSKYSRKQAPAGALRLLVG